MCLALALNGSQAADIDVSSLTEWMSCLMCVVSLAVWVFYICSETPKEQLEGYHTVIERKVVVLAVAGFRKCNLTKAMDSNIRSTINKL